MLTNLLQNNNPAFKELNDLIQKSGGDPERAFRAKAEEMGVNPDDIIKSLLSQ